MEQDCLRERLMNVYGTSSACCTKVILVATLLYYKNM